MKNLYCLLLFTFFIVFTAKGQNIIEHNGDTLITITPKEVKTINSIIVDLETSKDLISYQNKIIKSDSVIKSQKDSIISSHIAINSKKESYYIESVNNLQKSLEKEKRKKNILVTSLSFLAVILGILAIK